MKVGVVAVMNKGNEGGPGGAERLYQGLVGALKAAGAQASLVWVKGDESSFSAIQQTYLRCYDLEMSAFDAVVSTKAPTYLVRHPAHVCYLVHTMRVFYDMFGETFPSPSQELLRRRKLIRRLDSMALSPDRLKGLFTIGREVSDRLARYNGLESRVLRPATTLELHPGPAGDYFLVPGRLHRWKRVGLIIEAFRRTRLGCRLVICGTGEQEDELRTRAAADSRVEFRGMVGDSELADLYAGALAVVFTPVGEDFGYVALEAFLSGKPVLTCRDSGEPVRLVEHGVTGLVADPSPAAVAEAMKALAKDRKASEAMGAAALRRGSEISWPSVATELLAALES